MSCALWTSEDQSLYSKFYNHATKVKHVYFISLLNFAKHHLRKHFVMGTIIEGIDAYITFSTKHFQQIILANCFKQSININPPQTFVIRHHLL
jgi:hypothetical protein